MRQVLSQRLVLQEKMERQVVRVVVRDSLHQVLVVLVVLQETVARVERHMQVELLQ